MFVALSSLLSLSQITFMGSVEAETGAVSYKPEAMYVCCPSMHVDKMTGDFEVFLLMMAVVN